MGSHNGGSRCNLDGYMTIVFDHEFFNKLRREKTALRDQSWSERANDFLADLIIQEGSNSTDDETNWKVNFVALRSKLIENNFFDDQRQQRLQIDELVGKISSLRPIQRAAKPGVYVVIGQANKGKSRWLRSILAEIQEDSRAVLLSHDEPKLYNDDIGMSCGLAELLACFDELKDMRDVNVIALDGIRTIQYESTGNTLSGGVNSGFFRFLTDAGNAAVDAGVVCLFTYNPNTEKDETYKVVSAMVDGSVQGIIDLNSGTIRSRYHRRESFDLSRAFDILFADSIPQGDDMATDFTPTFDKTEL